MGFPSGSTSFFSQSQVVGTGHEAARVRGAFRNFGAPYRRTDERAP